MKKTSAAMLLVFAATLVFVAVPQAGASCPASKAGRLDAADLGEDFGFIWSQPLSAHFVAGEKLIVDFAVIPFANDMEILLRDNEQNSALHMYFDDGTETAGGTGYEPGKWNNVRATLDFDAQYSVARINGVDGTPQAFNQGAGDIVELLVLTPGASADPQRAWMDSIKLTKISGSTRTRLFTESFEQPPAPSGELEGQIAEERPDTHAAGEGANCPTKTTLGVMPAGLNNLKASGRLLPPHPGEEMTVVLFKKKDGDFVRVDKASPTLNAKSRYSTLFDAPTGANRCKVTAKFAKDADHRGSSASESFVC